MIANPCYEGSVDDGDWCVLNAASFNKDMMAMVLVRMALYPSP
jgi:hypothetical protein